MPLGSSIARVATPVIKLEVFAITLVIPSRKPFAAAIAALC
jgi:hypothetical protein